MSTRINDLGELQLAVLNVLWMHRQATVHEVIAALPSERKPAYTTILTVLRKLEMHGLITHDTAEGARMYCYRPLVTAHEARDHILQDVMQRLFAGSPVLLVKHLLQTEGFTLSELRDLKATIAAQERAITGSAAS
jgi:predicted transcriptional regulator